MLLRYRGHEKRLYGAEPWTTNNRMELTAVREGLKALKRHSRVRVTTDSQYVRNGITAWIHNWRRRGWKTAGKTAVKNQDLWQSLDEEASHHEVTWEWIKGHSGHQENELADRLANQAIDEMLLKGVEPIRVKSGQEPQL